jgi:uncharacterized protein YjbJ (UPF0337 family)
MAMNENTLKGTLDKVTGKIKETVGELTHNEELKRGGEADQVKGAARESVGHAQDAGQDAIDTVRKATK